MGLESVEARNVPAAQSFVRVLAPEAKSAKPSFGCGCGHLSGCSRFQRLISARRVLNLPSTPCSVGE